MGIKRVECRMTSVRAERDSVGDGVWVRRGLNRELTGPQTRGRRGGARRPQPQKARRCRGAARRRAAAAAAPQLRRRAEGAPGARGKGAAGSAI